jgi:transcriptional regulator with XRE-family HTH domain
MDGDVDLLEIVERHRNRRLPDPDRRRAIRIEAGFSQADFGSALGIDGASVSRYESGARTPRGALRERYASLLRALEQEVGE